MSELKIMILCGLAPRHLYVANRLCCAARVTAIVHETGDKRDLTRLRRLMKPSIFWQKSWRWLRDRHRYWGNPEAAFFFGKNTPQLDRPQLVHMVPHINHPQVLDLVQRHNPDFIAVFGTTLIRPPLLGQVPLINLHGGLSPEYRGADCTFWALHNGEPDKVGCTLHYIDAGIDTGRLIAHICPEIQEDDNELTLFWRTVQDSAEVYAEFFNRVAAGKHFGQVQPGKGRLYRVRDRTWASERRLNKALRKDLLKTLPARVHWFSIGSQAADDDSKTVGCEGIQA